MNRNQYILDTTITLMQTLKNLGVDFKEADDEIILDTLELHVDKVAQALNHKRKFNIGDTVFLRTDTEQNERLVTAIYISSGNITYSLNCGTSESTHYDFEISSEKDMVMKTK